MLNALRRFKLDDWIFFLTGLVAIGIGIAGFFITFKLETVVQILLAAIGLLITSVVTLKSQRQSDIQEIKSAIQSSNTVLLPKSLFNQHMENNLRSTRVSVIDTTLTATVSPINKTLPNKRMTLNINEYHQQLSKMIFERKLAYRKVEVIYSKERFELLIARMLLHDGFDYLIRYYESPPKSIPLLNITLLDNERIYIGGYDKSIDIQTIFTEDKFICKFILEYWNTLWSSGKPLNEIGFIDWEALRSLSYKYDITDNEFDDIVTYWRNWANQERKKYRLKILTN